MSEESASGQRVPTEIVIVSNRGPLSFRHGADGALEAVHGAGGLVSSLAPLVAGTNATWVAAAMTDADREAATNGTVETHGFRYRPLAIDAETYRLAYDVVSNSTLWFLNHRLFDLARRPVADRLWARAWDAYRLVNGHFADAVMDDAPQGATVLVQDYHLFLVGERLAKQRPDLRVVHFTHTPFCDPSELRALPGAVVEELFVAMGAYRACGFHTRRWADAFEACCATVVGASPSTFVSPLGPDAESLEAAAMSPACAQARRELEQRVNGCRMILRVDRLELSKNLLRGFLAFEELLAGRPEWIEKVVFVALAYPSREGVAEYVAYRRDVEALVGRINAEWGRPGWTPILLSTTDDYPRSIAALQSYDVLLVNPVRDGLNLVAKEGPLVNRRDGVLALSSEAGSWAELHGAALEVNPFDVCGTADVLAAALTMPTAERRARAAAVRVAAGRRTPRDWLHDQLAAAGTQR